MEDEIILQGGIAHQGHVVRIGSTVRRPGGAWSEMTRELLSHMTSVGFRGVPRYLGIDDQGRDVMSWIDGTTSLPPFQGPECTQEGIYEIGGLLRRFHDAQRGFDVSSVGSWVDELADPTGGTIVCHNDVCPENVILDGAKPTALVDFDFAAPGRPEWDVARTLRMCIPLEDLALRPTFPRELDATSRCQAFAKGYGLNAVTAGIVVELIEVIREQGRQFVQARLNRREPAFIEMWRVSNGEERNEAWPAWWKSHRSAIARALAAG